MTKTYTLELTAEELEAFDDARFGEDWNQGDKATLVRKISAARSQARAAREADELRLPWRAVGTPDNLLNDECRNSRRHFRVTNREGDLNLFTERAAKLMSAAPELLEAVRAWMRTYPKATLGNCVALSDRALRKVETGIPEEP